MGLEINQLQATGTDLDQVISAWQAMLNGTLRGRGISSVSRNSSTGVVTVTYTDNTTETFTVSNGSKGDTGDKGDKGDKGDTGNGISSITRNSSTGIVTVTYTNGTTETFTIPNGSKGDTGDKGDTGNGISSITRDSSTGVVTVTYTNGATDTFTVPNGGKGDTGATGAKGDKGDTGNGISSIARDSSTGVVTVTYTDGTTDTFSAPFFGGFEPDNMKGFQVVKSGNSVEITATLPDDTVIDNQTICTVAGAVIRKKSTGYPVDETDGTEVAVIYDDTTFIDPTTSASETMFYAAFPFTPHSVYNRNPVNRAVINEPTSMAKFIAKNKFNTSSNAINVDIVAQLPYGAAGAVIRKSLTDFPINENDGEAFATINANGTYTDTNVVVGQTYFYAAFPFTALGAYTRSAADRIRIIPKAGYLYGFDLNTTDDDPNTRVTYPDDVDNAGFDPAFMNFSTNTFNYGDWPSDSSVTSFMPKPCMLKYDGTVDHYLNPNDYTKKTDGTASSVASTAFDGNAMMEWGKIYTHRELVNGVYKFRCSNVKVGNDWDCWCNYNKNDGVIDHFYTSIYFGSLVSGKLRSISGQANSVETTVTSEVTYAKANGSDIWYTEVLADRLLIQDLLVLMSKSTDGQSKYGYGRCKSTNTNAIGQGTMNTKGMFWGSNDKTSGVKIFGMENWWGNLWRKIAGWINVSGTQKVKLTMGTHDGTTVSDYNTSGSGYLTVSSATPSGSSGGYIKTMKVESYGRIPVDASGASDKYEADAFYYETQDTRYALIGGGFDNDLLVGPFSIGLNGLHSYTNVRRGAALSCKPLA